MAEINLVQNQVQVKENHWLAKLAALKLGKCTMAVVVGSNIYLYGSTAENFWKNKAWAKHEMQHIAQYQKWGTVRFLALYVWYSLRHGYTNNPLEIEAKNAENL